MLVFVDCWILKFVFVLSVVIVVVFIYGFILIIGYLLLICLWLLFNYEFDGFGCYMDLFQNDVWWIFVVNFGWFGILFIVICVGFGLFFVILFDQWICNEGVLCVIFLYLMVLLFIVIGIVWQWILNLGFGFEKVMYDWGWMSFLFGWFDDLDKVIFCVVIVVVWQLIGFVMVLFFVGLCGVDGEIFKVVQVDGVMLFIIYCKIVILSMCLVFFLVLLIFCYIMIKIFDFVVVLIVGGLGMLLLLLVMFMYMFLFNCGQFGFGVVFLVMMFVIVVVVLVLLMYMELRSICNVV